MLRLGALLFPDPPRALPAHRAIGIALRTVHLTTVGTLLGGHVFDVDHSRLLPFLMGTILSGAALAALEMASTCAWLFTGTGVAVLVKLLLLSTIPLLWEHRVAILVVAVVVASVGAHMPARFRHHSFLSGRAAEPAGPFATKRAP